MRVVVVGVAMVFAVAACGGDVHSEADGSVVEGVVIDVQGDLSTVDAFVLLTADGERLTFVPAPEATFHGGAPLSHLGDHVRSGAPIAVTYRDQDGTLVAIEVDDA